MSDPGMFDDYIPISMLGASNDFYNYIIDSYHVFKREDGTTLKAAWEMYKTYCDEAKVLYSLPQRAFKEELKNYFRNYDERFNLDDGSRVRSYYSGFRSDKFEPEKSREVKIRNQNQIPGYLLTMPGSVQTYLINNVRNVPPSMPQPRKLLLGNGTIAKRIFRNLIHSNFIMLKFRRIT